MIPAHINFVVALPGEAKAVRHYFGLQRRQHITDYPVFGHENISLVISGVGKAAAADATEFLHHRNASAAPAIWINVGIAGHAHLPLGEAILAAKITDASSGRSWRPGPLQHPPVRTASVVTLDAPTDDYLSHGACDMEAAGFYSIANRCTRKPLAQCFKIISDNRENPARGISNKTIRHSIAAHCRSLSLLIERLEEARNSL